MLETLSGKVILITGATSGIGLATAHYFAKLGTRIVAAARNEDAGNDLVKSLDTDALFIKTDVTDESEVGELIAKTIDHFGGLNFAFNNAGIFAPEPVLDEHPTETWNDVMASNFSSVYYCMKAEARVMLGSDNDCAIINNASIIGHRGSAASGLAYTAAKHGVIGLTRQAAQNYAHTRLRINAVSPGPTLTAATAPRLDDSEETKTRIAGLNPTGALVPAEDIAAAVAYLCSPAARMINGHDIPLDGGQLAKL